MDIEYIEVAYVNHNNKKFMRLSSDSWLELLNDLWYPVVAPVHLELLYELERTKDD